MSAQLHQINKYYEDIPIIGNDNLRISATILFPLRNVSVIIRGEAGSGKTTIIKALLNLVWGPKVLEDGVPSVLFVGGTSDKGLLSDDLVDRLLRVATHCVIPELQYVINAPRNEDIIKAWTEGVGYPYTRAQDFGRSTQRIMLPPKPLMTSLANENKRVSPKGDIGEELERRFMPYYTESSKTMNDRVHNKKAEREAIPKWMDSTNSSSEVKEIRKHFEDCMRDFSDPVFSYEIYNPCAPYMRLGVPTRFTMSNTYIVYWHEMVKGITEFYYKERDPFDIKGHSVFLSTPGDNFIARMVIGQAVEYASLRLKDIGKIVMDSISTAEYETEKSALFGVSADTMSHDEIVDKVSDAGFDRSKAQIKQILDQLESAGYIKTTDHGRYYKNKEFGEFHTGVSMAKCIDDTKKFMRNQYPEIAEEYIDRYCDDPKVLSPIDGSTMRILDTDEVKKILPKPKEKKVMFFDTEDV